jgi:photosystem I subunit 9
LHLKTRSQFHHANFISLIILIKRTYSNYMNDFQKYLSTAPVLLTLWMTFTAGFIIETNRFFPDMLGLYF